MQYMLSPEEREARQIRRQAREAEQRLSNNRLAVTVFQVSWIMVFVSLVVVNWQLGFAPGWRPSDLQMPDLLLPTLATIALLGSTALAWHARRLVAAGQVSAFLSEWRIAIALGVVFLLIMLQQFFALPQGGEGTQYVFMYRLMIGYHALHTLAIGGLMVQVYRYGRRGNYGAEHSWPVEGSAKLWYFVTVAWIIFYVVLYWIR